MTRHGRESVFVVGEGIFTAPPPRAARSGEHPVEAPRGPQPPSALAELRKFRFSRLGAKAPEPGDEDRQLDEVVAEAMDAAGVVDPDSASPAVPAGFTYLAQFVDHDLTADKTAVSLGQDVTVAELIQGRSPALDLDSLYGLGPQREPQYYAADGIKLATGATVGVGFPADNPVAVADQQDFDLPRVGQGSSKAARRTPRIPDHRNDENLAVGQTHLMFIRFHNAVVDALAAEVPSALLFERARAEVVRHYQWVLRHDLLPRIVDPAVLDDVWSHGRQFFEVPYPYGGNGSAPYAPCPGVGDTSYGSRYVAAGDAPTMPIEFSVATYRLGHSMIRDLYEWNAVFRTGGAGGQAATLQQLFRFSGTSGNFTPGASPDDLGGLDDPESGQFERLPSNWIADFRRLYDFTEIGRTDLASPEGAPNHAKRIDTLLVNPLKRLPLGSFANRDEKNRATGRAFNLAFRNLARARMMRLGSGQQLAAQLKVEPLTATQILTGGPHGAALALPDSQAEAFVAATPLWFYVLREAELGDGRLRGVGARITAEVFHRAMEASVHSIVREPGWRPRFGRTTDEGPAFAMTDLLLAAVGGQAQQLFPLG